MSELNYPQVRGKQLKLWSQLPSGKQPGEGPYTWFRLDGHWLAMPNTINKRLVRPRSVFSLVKDPLFWGYPDGLPYLDKEFKVGDRVKLHQTTPELLNRRDPLHLGQLGTVRESPSGSLGVEFDNHSDTGWSAGLHAIIVHPAPGVHIFDLCVEVKNAPSRQ